MAEGPPPAMEQSMEASVAHATVLFVNGMRHEARVCLEPLMSRPDCSVQCALWLLACYVDERDYTQAANVLQRVRAMAGTMCPSMVFNFARALDVVDAYASLAFLAWAAQLDFADARHELKVALFVKGRASNALESVINFSHDATTATLCELLGGARGSSARVDLNMPVGGSRNAMEYAAREGLNATELVKRRDKLARVLLLGPAGSGKTCLMHRLTGREPPKGGAPTDVCDIYCDRGDGALVEYWDMSGEAHPAQWPLLHHCAKQRELLVTIVCLDARDDAATLVSTLAVWLERLCVKDAGALPVLFVATHFQSDAAALSASEAVRLLLAKFGTALEAIRSGGDEKASLLWFANGSNVGVPAMRDAVSAQCARQGSLLAVPQQCELLVTMRANADERGVSKLGKLATAASDALLAGLLPLQPRRLFHLAGHPLALTDMRASLAVYRALLRNCILPPVQSLPCEMAGWFSYYPAEAHVANRMLSLAWKDSVPHVDQLLTDCRVSRVGTTVAPSTAAADATAAPVADATAAPAPVADATTTTTTPVPAAAAASDAAATSTPATPATPVPAPVMITLSVTDWDSSEVARVRVAGEEAASLFEEAIRLHAANHNERPRTVVTGEEVTSATAAIGMEDPVAQRLVLHSLVAACMLVRLRRRAGHYIVPWLLPRALDAEFAQRWSDSAFKARHARQYAFRASVHAMDMLALTANILDADANYWRSDESLGGYSVDGALKTVVHWRPQSGHVFVLVCAQEVGVASAHIMSLHAALSGHVDRLHVAAEPELASPLLGDDTSSWKLCTASGMPAPLREVLFPEEPSLPVNSTLPVDDRALALCVWCWAPAAQCAHAHVLTSGSDRWVARHYVGGRAVLRGVTCADGKPCAIRVTGANSPEGHALFDLGGLAIRGARIPQLRSDPLDDALREDAATNRQAIIMEWIDGTPLSSLPTVAAVRECIGRLALLLHFVHELGVMHMGLRPSRVMCCPPEPGRTVGDYVLVSFGAARVISRRATARVKSDMWTDPWAAPELATDSAPTRACDVFSLGMVAVQLLLDWTPARLSDMRIDGEDVRWRLRMCAKSKLTPDDVALFASMCDHEASKRPSLQQVADKLGVKL